MSYNSKDANWGGNTGWGCSELCKLVQIVPDEKQNSVQYGDALFTLSSETPEEVGMGAVYLGKSQKLYLNSFCFGVHFHGNRVLPQYIAHFISSTSFRKAIYPLAQGSTRFNLQKQDFMRMKFVLPSLEEQERIATALDALHNHLANEKLLTEQYLLLKQFLLQQMFIWASVEADIVSESRIYLIAFYLMTGSLHRHWAVWLRFPV